MYDNKRKMFRKKSSFAKTMKNQVFTVSWCCHFGTNHIRERVKNKTRYYEHGQMHESTITEKSVRLLSIRPTNMVGLNTPFSREHLVWDNRDCDPVVRPAGGEHAILKTRDYEPLLG